MRAQRALMALRLRLHGILPGVRVLFLVAAPRVLALGFPLVDRQLQPLCVRGYALELLVDRLRVDQGHAALVDRRVVVPSPN